MPELTYPFTEAECKAAYEEYGCNCGPTALAFACQLKLSAVRHAIPDFDAKRYTSPTMMKAALKNLGVSFKPYEFIRVYAGMFGERPALTRIQWTGPWTAPTANPKWAYRLTHWICTWKPADGSHKVFDVNGGILDYEDWKNTVVPVIVASIPRADGSWFQTHIWRLAAKE